MLTVDAVPLGFPGTTSLTPAALTAGVFLPGVGKYQIQVGLAHPARDDRWYSFSASCSRFLRFQMIANTPRSSMISMTSRRSDSFRGWSSQSSIASRSSFANLERNRA